MTSFTTPLCTLYGGSPHLPVLGLKDHVIMLALDPASALVMRVEMRQFLRGKFGAILGSRASVPLSDLDDGRSVLLCTSHEAPTLCDRSGYPCGSVWLGQRSLIRVSGLYEAMNTPGLVPVMQAIQVCRAVQDNAERCFTAYEPA